ncbi:MAG: hypothetical protein ACYC3I_23005, partial [Gemmataceae bacterium]
MNDLGNLHVCFRNGPPEKRRLTIGSPTVANLLRTLGAFVPGDPSSYRRFFWQRRWSSWRLAKRLTAWILLHLLADGSVILVGCV